MDVNIVTSPAIKTKNGRLSRSKTKPSSRYQPLAHGSFVGYAERRRGRRRSGKSRSAAGGSWPPLSWTTASAAHPQQQRDGKMFRVLVEPPSAGVFFSGSEIRGYAQVTTEEEKKFKYIHVSLTGRAQVWWVDSSSQREYGGEKEYLHETQMLWTKEDSPDGLTLFPAGSHTFPFQFHLPSKIPSSFEGRVGWVRYELQGRIVTGVMKVEHLVEIELPVMEIVDINRSHLLAVKNVQVQKKVWSFPCTLSNVSMVVGLSRTGFCVGEDIPLNIGLENGSRYEVTLAAVLRQKITYTAKRTRRQYDKATVVEVASQRFAPRVSTIWPTNLRVPLQEATTQDYEVIRVEYRIKVVASVGWGQTLIAKIPITIGNIPFSNSLFDRDIHCSRDQLQFGSYDDQYSLSTDDRSSKQFGLSQLDHTPKSLPHSESQHSCDAFTTTGSYLYDSECTYSIRDYIDGGEFSDSDLCTRQNSN